MDEIGTNFNINPTEEDETGDQNTAEPMTPPASAPAPAVQAPVGAGIAPDHPLDAPTGAPATPAPAPAEPTRRMVKINGVEEEAPPMDELLRSFSQQEHQSRKENQLIERERLLAEREAILQQGAPATPAPGLDEFGEPKQLTQQDISKMVTSGIQEGMREFAVQQREQQMLDEYEQSEAKYASELLRGGVTVSEVDALKRFAEHRGIERLQDAWTIYKHDQTVEKARQEGAYGAQQTAARQQNAAAMPSAPGAAQPANRPLTSTDRALAQEAANPNGGFDMS